jgi:bacillithiol biosynthesis cysteine-adding enzyme BshC
MTDTARSRVITEPLGGSPLSQAIQGRRLPRDLQPWWPAGVDEWREHAGRARSNGDWYTRVRDALTPGGAARARIERAAAEQGILVTTGQQPGLFGGPLYTLAKALTALGLADTLERELGIPVAPVFWAATDDADFAEAAVTHAADADGLHTLALSDAPPAGTPMSHAPLVGVGALLAALRKSCGSAAYAEYFELARAFEEGRTVGDAYVRMLRGILEPLGISVFDSGSAAYHEAARPVLIEALTGASAIAARVAERTAEIRRIGFEPQVEDDRGLSLVFSLEGGVKRRITVAEAPGFAQSASGQVALTPNVLLRPLLERELLPTVAYVAGPGELAYFAQANAVAAALDRPPLVAVPRWSCTVIEPFAARAMQRLDVELHELRDLPTLERRLATASMPASVADAWRRLQEQLHASIQDLGDAVARESLMLPTVIEGLERSLGQKLGRAERRLLAAVKRKEEHTRRDLMVASSALFPLGKRQERVLNFIPMLTRGGDDLLNQMRAAATGHAQTLVRAARAEPVAAR